MSKINIGSTNWFTDFGLDSLLPSDDFPVLFHSVQGKCQTKFGNEDKR